MGLGLGPRDRGKPQIRSYIYIYIAMAQVEDNFRKWKKPAIKVMEVKEPKHRLLNVDMAVVLGIHLLSLHAHVYLNRYSCFLPDELTA